MSKSKNGTPNKLYIKNGDKCKSFKDLMILFFSVWNGMYYVAVESYLDPECKTRHCIRGRLRSFDDICALGMTYFPELTHKEMFRIFESIVLTHPKRSLEGLGMHYGHCSGIKRQRFIFYTQEIKWDTITKLNQYDSEYHLKDMYGWLGVTDQKSLEKHRHLVMEAWRKSLPEKKETNAKEIKVKPEVELAG